MSETTELVIGICLLIGVIALTRKYHTWRIKRALVLIVRDLRAQNAFTQNTAVDLPYAKRSILKMGVRDHRPMALDHLVLDKIVGVTQDGKYYLTDRSV